MKKMILIAAMLGIAAGLSVRAADAKANWDHHCAMCHGKDGKGNTRIGHKLGCKDFTDAKVQADLKDAAAIKAIKDGLKSDDGRKLMKPFGSTFSDSEIKDLVAYVRSFKK